MQPESKGVWKPALFSSNEGWGREVRGNWPFLQEIVEVIHGAQSTTPRFRETCIPVSTDPIWNVSSFSPFSTRWIKIICEEILLNIQFDVNGKVLVFLFMLWAVYLYLDLVLFQELGMSKSMNAKHGKGRRWPLPPPSGVSGWQAHRNCCSSRVSWEGFPSWDFTWESLSLFKRGLPLSECLVPYSSSCLVNQAGKCTKH